jgi:hypothetical protein
MQLPVIGTFSRPGQLLSILATVILSWREWQPPAIPLKLTTLNLKLENGEKERE